MITWIKRLFCDHLWQEDPFPIDLETHMNNQMAYQLGLVPRKCMRCGKQLMREYSNPPIQRIDERA